VHDYELVAQVAAAVVCLVILAAAAAAAPLGSSTTADGHDASHDETSQQYTSHLVQLHPVPEMTYNVFSGTLNPTHFTPPAASLCSSSSVDLSGSNLFACA